MARSKMDQLFARVCAVADRHPVQGIDLARLSTALSELPGRGRVVARALAELVGHANPSRRRIGLHACRKIGRFDAPGLREELLQRLADEDPWVRHDAAWAVHAAGYDGKDVRDALVVLSEGVSLPDDRRRLTANPGNADLAARVRAREALDALMPREVTSGGVVSCGDNLCGVCGAGPLSTHHLLTSVGRHREGYVTLFADARCPCGGREFGITVDDCLRGISLDCEECRRVLYLGPAPITAGDAGAEVCNCACSGDCFEACAGMVSPVGRGPRRLALAARCTLCGSVAEYAGWEMPKGARKPAWRVKG